ncbi:MAG: hypothetical protein K6L81_16395 [Agarilytica sp.]
MTLASFSYSFDDKSLWLPGKYGPLFLELKKAAQSAENLERCVTILRGTIDLDDSTSGHPIYRFLCRQPNGRTYNEMVDGVTFETLTTILEVPVEPTEEELEALRLAEEKRKQEERDARILHLWGLCETELGIKVRLMKDIQWITPFPAVPDEVTEESAAFTVDFDAKNVQGAALAYRAKCRFSENDALKVRISAREK